MSRPAVADTLPIVDEAMKRLSKGAGGVLNLSEKAINEVSAQLDKLKGKPQFQEALQQLTTFAYMLSEKKNSKAASAAIMGLVQKAVGFTKAAASPKPAAAKPASSGGWGPKPKR